MGFTLATLTTKLEQQGLAHSELHHLMAAHSMCCYLILRYCLAARWVYWMRTVPPSMTAVPAQIHDRRMQDSLAALLDMPAATLPPLVIRQAQLPTRNGGLALPSMVLLATTAYLAAACTAMRHAAFHHRSLIAAPLQPVATGTSAFLVCLRAVHDQWRQQLADGHPVPSLASLLSATQADRASQHCLAEGVHARQVAELTSQLTDEAAARFRSCSGQHAGSWLAVFPTSFHTTARSCHYRLALRIRLGIWLPGLASGSITCGGCGLPVDPQGMHYGFCKNRHGVWTTRHDTLEAALHHVLCYLRQRVRYTRGAGNLFNDVRPPRSRGNKPGWRRADLVIDGYRGIGRHLFLDVAIPDPCCPTARAAGSATSTGAAASAKEKYKQNKYNPLAQRVGGQFIPTIIERFGAFGDALVGLIKTLTGEAQRDPLIDDDYVFSTSSRTTYVASQLCFTAVIADAYMIDQLMAHDVSGCPLGAAVPAPAPPRVSPPSGVQRASDPCFYEVAGMYRHD